MSIGPLQALHRFDGFDCGDAARNGWLQSRARPSQGNDDSRCYVAVGADNRVFGFYALTTAAILRGALPGAMRRNAPDPVSCVQLAQLGVDLSVHGQGIGRALVLHAMQQTVKIAEIAGCRLLILHPAPPERAGYYQKFGFTEIEAVPAVMAMSLRTVRATLEAINL